MSTMDSQRLTPINVQRSLTKDRVVYVLGHRNPDTDSVVSAHAYASLKRALGTKNIRPARAGKTTLQTDYIFNRFNTPIPEFLPDLIPRVDYYDNHGAQTISTGVSLWEAMSVMRKHDMQALAVVDADGCYHSLLHYGFIAERLLQINNPNRKTAIQTSVDLVASVLNAQKLAVSNPVEVRKSPIVVAAAEFETFKEILATHVPANAIVITGNRLDVQRHAIETGVRMVIVTNGNIVDKELRTLALERGVSVLSSPYDTSSTTLQIVYAMPVTGMSSREIGPVNQRDPIRKIAPLLSDAPGKSLPVVDDDGRVVGVISESDLFREPNIDVIMVDHNEFSQAIEGIENYRILEIIDHHRLGSLATRAPITFINRPVGATCTIVAGMYREQRVPLSQDIASLLLCGILADTLILQSATTTQEDRDMAEYLANVSNHDIPTLGREILQASSRVSGRTAKELVGQDMKEYTEQGEAFTVSQIEVEEPGEVLERKEEFLGVLEKERNRGNKLFSALLVTDITVLSSIMILAADPKFVPHLSLTKIAESVYELHGVVSRKKQLLPILSEMIEGYHGD